MKTIQTDKLTKKFGNVIALENVSLNVREGEIYGFLGLNGAGKTTAIRLLLGMIKPDSGSISLLGVKPQQSSEIWNNIGYMVETPNSYPNLTIRENLEVYYHLRGLRDKTQVSKIIKVLHLGSYENMKAKYLSLGNSQRLGLAKALMHNPKILILDEPINGLDPAGIVEVRKFLKELVKKNNTTIFLSSHILSEISKISTRIGIVHQGKLIREIDTNELADQIIKRLCINTVDNPKALLVLKSKGFSGVINNVGFIESTDRGAIQHPESISTLLVNLNLPPKMINVFEEDLENYFLRIIEN